MLARIAALFTALAAAAAPVSAQALEGPRQFQVNYSISLYGLNIGRSAFRSTISGDTFSVDGTLQSSGVARIFDSTKGTTSVTGRFAGEQPRPDSFVLSYASGRKEQRTAIAFADGVVTDTKNVPPNKPPRGKWVALSDGDLRAVSDPLSGTLVRAADLRDVCNRTLKLYDGEMRADLRLSFAEMTKAEARGYSGEAVTCAARFVPVAGYRADRDSIQFLKNKSRIRLTFAPLGDTGVYAPIRITATTEIGTITIAAARFEEVK